MNATKVKTPKGMTFEKALQRLQEIVAELEDSEKGLEKSLELFEEGVGLSRFCRGRIEEIQKRVELVLKETPEGFVTEPFDEAEAEDVDDLEDEERR